MTYAHVISEDEFNLASRLASATNEQFHNRPGHYNNTVNSHLRGKVGEIASTNFLLISRLNVSEAWKDLNLLSEADLIINGKFRIDVKTWDIRYWEEMGRCVSVGQLPYLKAKADAVIWCTSDSRLEPDMKVTVVGWSRLIDIEASNVCVTGPALGRQVTNHQVEMSAIRSLESLIADLNNENFSSTPPRG